MHPFLAELDIGQAIFVIVFLVVGFIQWLIKVLKEKAEAAKRAAHVPTQEETEARRRAWEEQARPVASAPQPQPQEEPKTGGGFKEVIAEMRKAYEEATHPPIPVPAPPPPLPPAPPVKPLAPPREARVAHLPMVSTPAIVVTSEHSVLRKRGPHPLTRLLRTEDGYRQAFVLREILGPPRALEEYRGTEQ